MTQKEKKVIYTILLIMLMSILIILCIKIFGKTNEMPVSKSLQEQNKNIENNQNEEKHVTQLSNGIKLNSSEALKGVKKYKDLEISNIQLTSKNNSNVILANVKNIGNTTFNNEIIKFTILGENDEIIAILFPVIPNIPAGETRQLNTETTKNIINAKDFKIEKK